MSASTQQWAQRLSANTASLTAVSLLVTYGLFLLLQGGNWIGAWLKGSSGIVYQVAFVSMTYLGLLASLAYGRGAFFSSSWRAGVTGVLIGHACGVASYLILVLLLPYGAEKLQSAVARGNMADSLMILVVPGVLLGWLVGAVAAVLMAVVRAKSQSRAASN
jgi:hypothetical protein